MPDLLSIFLDSLFILPFFCCFTWFSGSLNTQANIPRGVTWGGGVGLVRVRACVEASFLVGLESPSGCRRFPRAWTVAQTLKR
jgi:hypothetical protein